MKKKVFAVLSLIGLLAVGAGCYTTVDGRVKAGVPFSKDEIINRYERPVDQVFSAAKETLTFNGTLVGENRIDNTLEAKIDTRTVWVKVTQVEVNLTEVVVQARERGGVPDVDLASEIATQIALRLK